MKESFQEPLYQSERAWVSSNRSSFLKRRAGIVLTLFLLIISINFTSKAGDGDHRNKRGVPAINTLNNFDNGKIHDEIPRKISAEKKQELLKYPSSGKFSDMIRWPQMIKLTGDVPSSVDLATTAAEVSIVANYCIVAGKVRLTASSSPAGATYLWSTGETGSVIDVDIAKIYSVAASFSNGESATASKKVAEELVTNGDFSAGNTGFFTEYGYAADIAGNTELNPEGLYAVGTSGQNYHGSFYGKEHTTSAQTGNFMLINGSTSTIGTPPRQRTIWQQTVTVLQNTNYYFSAYAMNLNPGSPANLQFEVNGVLVGTTADLSTAPKPTSDATVNINNWIRFYSNPTWNSGSNTTAVIRIINLNTTASGNDFALDDISFSTLSPFITLVSAAGTNSQTTCMNAPITPIVYSVGSDASGHSITNLPAGVTASFSVANYLTISGSPTVAGNYTFSITTTGTCNPVTVTGTINIPSIYNTWSGTLSDDWSNANNWSCGTIPIATTNVIIPSNAVRMPRLTANSMCKILELMSSSVLDLNGQSFSNYGGIIGTGLLKGSVSSNLTIDAAGTASTISFDQSTQGATNALNNLTVAGLNNSVALNSRVALYGVLSPENGTLTINDTLVLRSTNSGTARVGVVSGALAYGSAGRVDVERYYPARRSWRLVTSPLSGGGSIFDNWQNGGVYAAGKGTYVSGAGATNPTAANGLDWSPQNNSSLKIGITFTPVLNTRVNISKNLADTSDNITYFLFVRGDRNPANTNPYISNNTTLSSKGKLQTGRQTFTAASTQGGFAFVGNPYAAPVDFSKLTLTNLKKHFWVWDPYLNTDQGGYILIEEVTAGVYEAIPQSPAGMNQVLQSSQGFLVETKLNGPASVTFQESSKSNAASNITAFRPAGSVPYFRANFFHLNEDNMTLLLDGVMAIFDTSFNKGVDMDDVVKQVNPREGLALVRDNKLLGLERRPLPESYDTLYLRLGKTTQRKYRLEFLSAGLGVLTGAFLEDSYTALITPLNLTTTSVYDFEINGTPESANFNRFRILFKHLEPLPVTYRTISAKGQANNIAVNWTVENELNIRRYEVKRSSDGVHFGKVHTTGAGTASDYIWIDQHPLIGNNYYRIRGISADGKSDYSKTAFIKTVNVVPDMRISPNPLTGNVISIEMTNMTKGFYGARILNAVGQIEVIKRIDHAAGTSTEKIWLDKKLPAGVYQLEITKPDQNVVAVKLIVQ